MTTPQMFDMTSRVAIVTGGATHLGRSMATALAELGATVVIASRRKELCEQVAAEMSSQGLKVEGMGCDATDKDSVAAMVDAVVEKHGRLDVMVCNAGGVAAPTTYVPEGDIDEFTATLQLNVNSTYLCANEAGRVMVKQRSGSIITIGSIHGSLTNDKRFYDGLNFRRGGAAYQTAKGGIINFTRYLAMELGEYGITANCISPGMIPLPDADPHIIERSADRNPLRRGGVPKDLSGAVALLASPAGSWITGHNLIVDGGWSIW
jgi:gluconate 5-dehydrogenase